MRQFFASRQPGASRSPAVKHAGRSGAGAPQDALREAQGTEARFLRAETNRHGHSPQPLA